MSGKAWSPERKAAHAARMRARWLDPDYRAAQSEKRRAAMTPARRAEKSVAMRALNERMKTDPSLKGANLAGIRRSYSGGRRSADVADRMRETMARPGMREIAAEHCRGLAGSGHTLRGWKTRRLNALRRKVEAKIKRRAT